jgi:hypothetical protein
LSVLLLALLGASPTAVMAFMYRPATGLTWDPSCMTWEGKTYCYFMYVCGTGTPGCTSNETHYGHGLVAVAPDGVHFKTHSAFNAEAGNVGWFKCMIHKVTDVEGKPMFVMDHGTSGPVTGPDDPTKQLSNDRGCPAGTSQCLRFLKSTDALHWEYMYTLHPDPKWYRNTNGVSKGRWDHAYIQEDTGPTGGFIAFPVATPIGNPAPGQLRSKDGLNWTVEAPTVVSFGDVVPTSFEIGGVEKMENDRYYMIGGGSGPPQAANSYSMWTLRSNGSEVAGPYAPDSQAYRLSGQDRGATANFGQALAAWSRNYDTYPKGALISQYMVMPHTEACGAQKSLAGGGHVWLLPLRQPRVDADGHLRLGHWSGNDALRGDPISLPPTLGAAASVPGGDEIDVAWFAGSDQWDHAIGVVISGVLLAGTEAAQIGFAVQTIAPPPPPIPHADDPGPDKGFDRPGNDYNCFAVNASFTPADCAAACEADAHCMAWTTIDVSQDAQEKLVLPCQHGKPLTSRYCTLKSPVPTVIKPSPPAYTGLPSRSLRNSSHPAKNATSAETVTSMLMEIKPNTDLTRSTRVRDFAVGGSVPPKVRDTAGPFECGDPKQKKSVTCLPATTTGVSVGSHPFLAYVPQSVSLIVISARRTLLVALRVCQCK